MTEQKALVLFDEMRALTVGGLDPKQMVAYGEQLRKILPNALSLTALNAFKYGMYCAVTHANPFRGEIYAWEDRDGNLLMSEGYKLLIRWAENQAKFIHWFNREDPKDHGLSADDLIVRAFVLREDKVPTLERLIKAGFSKEDAEARVAATAVGVVLADEMFITRDWDKQAKKWKKRPRDKWWPKDPPKGWTWETRGETRALKNTLKRSHGVPTDEELAQASWQVDGVRTIPSDWRDVVPGMSSHEAEQMAKLEAEAREWRAARDALSPEELQAQFERGVEVLRGEDVDPLAPEALAKEPEQPPVIEDVEPEDGELESLYDSIALALAKFDDDEAEVDGKTKWAVQRVMDLHGRKIDFKTFQMRVGQIQELLKELREENIDDE